jgi:hypothetical protein
VNTPAPREPQQVYSIHEYRTNPLFLAVGAVGAAGIAVFGGGTKATTAAIETPRAAAGPRRLKALIGFAVAFFDRPGLGAFAPDSA